MNLPQLGGADFLPLLPAMVLCLGAMVVLLSEVFLSASSRAHQAMVALLSSALAGGLAVATAFEPARQVFGGMGVQDPFSSLITLVVAVGLVLAILFSAGFLRAHRVERGEFYALVLFAGAGMSLLAASAELITLFVNLEILSISTYALTSYLRKGTRPAEAAFKYFILGAFSSAVLLYGAALLYGATGTTKLYEMSSALSTAVADPSQRWLVYCGIVLLGAGFAFKVAAVPFHMWTPDVYEGAPTPVTALMSAGVKAAAFAALVRVFFSLGKNLDPRVPFLLLAGLALFTMVGGNLLALPQRNVKRMLAYSSIAHAGYLLLGVCVLFARPGGKGWLEATPLLPGVAPQALTPEVFKGLLFYLLGYTVSAVGAFGTVAALERREDEERGTAWDLERFSGLAQRRPGWAVAMAVFMLSLAGIPPTVGFLAKLLIFRAAVDAGLIGLTVVAVLSSAAGAYYYLRVVVQMFMRPAPAGAEPLARHWPTELALVASTVAVVLLGIVPLPISEWLSRAGLMLGAP